MNLPANLYFERHHVALEASKLVILRRSEFSSEHMLKSDCEVYHVFKDSSDYRLFHRYRP